MTAKNLLSLILSAGVTLLIFIVMYLIGNITFFGLFDTTSTIQEYKDQEYYAMVLILCISAIIAIGVVLFLGLKKRFRFWGAISIVFIIFILFAPQLLFDTKDVTPFDQQKWSSTEKDKFVEATGIVLNNSFIGFTKDSVIHKLGQPTRSSSTQLHYNIHHIYDWVFSIELDSCCVIKTELTKDPWNL